MLVILHCSTTFSSASSEALVIHIPYFLSVGSFQEARAQVIQAGQLDPTPDISKAISETEAISKVNSFRIFILFSIQAESYISGLSNTPITFNDLCLFLDANRQPANNLSKVATIDIDSLLTKTSDISKGVIYNI